MCKRTLLIQSGPETAAVGPLKNECVPPGWALKCHSRAPRGPKESNKGPQRAPRTLMGSQRAPAGIQMSKPRGALKYLRRPRWGN